MKTNFKSNLSVFLTNTFGRAYCHDAAKCLCRAMHGGTATGWRGDDRNRWPVTWQGPPRHRSWRGSDAPWSLGLGLPSRGSARAPRLRVARAHPHEPRCRARLALLHLHASPVAVWPLGRAESFNPFLVSQKYWCCSLLLYPIRHQSSMSYHFSNRKMKNKSSVGWWWSCVGALERWPGTEAEQWMRTSFQIFSRCDGCFAGAPSVLLLPTPHLATPAATALSHFPCELMCQTDWRLLAVHVAV